MPTGTLTAPPAASRYAAAIAATPGLLTHWRLGEQAGGFDFDQQGLRLGAFKGGYTLGQQGAIAGDTDTAAGFNGTNGQMLGAGPVLSGSATIEGWFLWQAGRAVLRDDTWTQGWVLAYANSGGNLGYRIGDKTFDTGQPVAIARDGIWHHIAVTKTGGSTAFYLDGQLLHSGTGAPSKPSTAPWHLMRHGEEPHYTEGRADEIAFYDAALPARMIRGHHDIGRGDVTAPDTTVASGPDGPTNGSSPSFSFTSPDPNAEFTCRLDGPGGLDRHRDGMPVPAAVHVPRRRVVHVQRPRDRPGGQCEPVAGHAVFHRRHGGARHGDPVGTDGGDDLDRRVVRVLVVRGPVVLRVSPRRGRLGRLRSPSRVHGPGRGSPHVRGALHRRGEEHGSRGRVADLDGRGPRARPAHAAGRRGGAAGAPG